MIYVLVTGGVISGIGKGVIASSTGTLFKTLGLRVTAVKIDPYINIDAGTLSPLDHGEVFVLDDGGEVDLDLGNYERFLNVTLKRENNITTGKIYQNVIEKERRGDYLGKTVQVVPHITNAVQDWIESVAQVPVDDSGLPPEVCIIELGGTVGDIESAPFIEAMRQFQFRVGHENFALIHVSLIPIVGAVGEQKTKPTQASVRDLRGLGLTPDFIACRCASPLLPDIKEKISMFCHVTEPQILDIYDCGSIYEVPLLLAKQGMLAQLQKRLNIPNRPTLSQSTLDFNHQWKQLAARHYSLKDEITIALVGKYTHLKDSYISVVKALQHAAVSCNRKIVIEWVEASHLEAEGTPEDKQLQSEAFSKLKGVSGILVPGGFGNRGTKGKIAAAKFARENKIPYLGICLGLQVAVIEYARNVLQLEGAHSYEFEPTSPHPVVIFMPEMSKTHLGGTMRLGARPTSFVEKHKKQSKAFFLYGKHDTISERHRHRYEVNPAYIERLEAAGLNFVGQDDKFERMEIIENSDHPFFVACQYHPEYKSRPLSPSPLFLGFVLASGGLFPQYVTQMNNKEQGLPSPIHERVVEDDADAHLGKYSHATRCDSPFVPPASKPGSSD